MTAAACRWQEDPSGRCADPVAFPGAHEVPPFCIRHLGQLEPWVRSRVAAHQADAGAWLRWAARKAEAADDELKALGILRPARAVDDGRPVIPNGPVRR
ncbi:MAG TPA: hypothetical protein VHZ03_14590 [Trebonia sp.]|nr:hypothetical protein [Trebonia sp.]